MRRMHGICPRRERPTVRSFAPGIATQTLDHRRRGVKPPGIGSEEVGKREDRVTKAGTEPAFKDWCRPRLALGSRSV